MEIGLQQGSDQLTDAQGSAGVQAQRHNEQVDAKCRDQLSDHGDDQPQPSVMQGVVEHNGSLHPKLG